MAEIGKLVAKLQVDKDQLEKGLDSVKKQVRSMGPAFRAMGKAVKVAVTAAAAAVVAWGASVTAIVKTMASDFDKLTKLSRSIGIPVERLSALQHAAELSGASVDELARGFRNLARNMQAEAEAPTAFGRALESLNVQWREANGSFVQADEIMLRVAEKFKNMQDGAGKTALAMKIFGEEMGPKFVSLLNSGRDGIDEMTQEAKELGLVLTETQGKAAEKFNDTMDRLWKVVRSFGNELAKRTLPALTYVAEGLLNWAKSSGVAQKSAQLLASVTTGLIDIAYRVTTAWEAMGLRVAQVFHNIKSAASFSFSEIEERNRIVDARIRKIYGDLQYDLAKVHESIAESAVNAGAQVGEGFTSPIVQSIKDITDAETKRNEAEAERLRIMEALRTPEEAMIARQQHLGELFQNGAIMAETYGRAMAQASAFSARNMDDLATSVSGALGTIFENSKGAAIASALINTYQGISKAIATYPPPLSGIMAAIQAAMGFAQVAKIKSTTKNGSGGGGGSGVGGGGANVPTASPQVANITLQGTTFGRDQVTNLLRELGSAIGDGAKLVVR